MGEKKMTDLILANTLGNVQVMVHTPDREFERFYLDEVTTDPMIADAHLLTLVQNFLNETQAQNNPITLSGQRFAVTRPESGSILIAPLVKYG